MLQGVSCRGESSVKCRFMGASRRRRHADKKAADIEQTDGFLKRVTGALSLVKTVLFLQDDFRT